MRGRVPVFVLVAALLGPAAALAGPTCQDRSGDTVRCGTQGAMPVGWVLPWREREDRPRPEPVSPGALIGLVCALGGVFALIALMPDFQGRGGGWDRLEEDDEEALD